MLPGRVSVATWPRARPRVRRRPLVTGPDDSAKVDEWKRASRAGSSTSSGGTSTRSASSAPTRPGPHESAQPRLRRLVPWLDHLIELGANGLALGLVFASVSHGYDTIDFHEVDPRLGTSEDLAHLIEEAHRRGIRVMLDGVFNHVGREFPQLLEAQADPSGAAAALFQRDGAGGLATFEGHGGLVALDHSNSAVVDLVVDVMDHWLGVGADAWRLDAAYSVPSGFWAAVLPRVRARQPDVYVLGEVLHGDYTAMVMEGQLDSVTQHELWLLRRRARLPRRQGDSVRRRRRHPAGVSRHAARAVE